MGRFDEHTARSVWIGWAGTVMSIGLAYFTGGVFWAYLCVFSGVVLALRGHFPNWFINPINGRHSSKAWAGSAGAALVLSLMASSIHHKVTTPSPLLVRSELVVGTYPPGTALGGIGWDGDLRDLRLSIENPTDGDVSDLDFVIRPDFPNVYITQIGEVSNVPAVSFVSTELYARQGPNGEPLVKFDSTTGHTPQDGWRFQPASNERQSAPLRVIPNHYRFRCEKLPYRSTLELSLAIASKDLSNGTVSKVWIKGTYTGGMRNRALDMTISTSH